ncbi:putative glycolipid-binding domain-containing protein [Skermania piniformis]
MLTWRAPNAPRMESVRVQVNGQRIKASGRIIGADCPDHAAFSASYDLVTTESGVTQRLSLRTSVAGGERFISINRDGEGYWMIDTGASHQRSAFDGALDVDVVLSPFFNTLPIRRYRLHEAAEQREVPVVYVTMPDLAVHQASLTYSPTVGGLQVRSPVSEALVTVDADGFIRDYAGLAERI